ncbi:MAG TPA: Lrp/AsnC family transcriptional regulator [Actinomycetota bacterium]|nr:Lrp/AsnC family transcriptional regulator [Actinomycetota bacterium]
MDATDRRIVALLEQDARLTYGEVGKRVGLAASSVHDRVRKLERAGVLRGYRADVDFAAVGLPITAFVSLALRPSSPADIPGRVAEFPLVESVYSVAGDNSYVLVVRAPSTTALEELLDALRAKLEVVTRSTIVLSTPFERRPMTSTAEGSVD